MFDPITALVQEIVNRYFLSWLFGGILVGFLLANLSVGVGVAWMLAATVAVVVWQVRDDKVFYLWRHRKDRRRLAGEDDYVPQRSVEQPGEDQ